MTYHNATKYLFTAPDELPEATAGNRLRQFLVELGDPQKKLTYFRITGSNGKTVCSKMLTSIFHHSEYKVGCLTMPLRDDVRENILIDHEPISMSEIEELVGEIYSLVKTINKRPKPIEEEEDDELVLTKYEILLCTALLAFLKHGCSLCIIESGNVAGDPTRYLPAPIAAAICGTIPSQSQRDIHQIRSYLCHGIREIVSAPQDQDAYHIISQICASISCRLTIPTKAELHLLKSSLGGSEFCYKGKAYKLPLCGEFQITNATVTLEVVHMLARHGFTLSDDAIAAGLQDLKMICKLEVLSISPTIIADSTHSPEAIQTVCHCLAEFQTQIGTRISLCLPDTELAEQYECALHENGFGIGTVLLHGVEDAPEPYVGYTRTRDTVSHIRSGSNPDEVWLISGPHPFTAKLRHELLQAMGF